MACPEAPRFYQACQAIDYTACSDAKTWHEDVGGELVCTDYFPDAKDAYNSLNDIIAAKNAFANLVGEPSLRDISGPFRYCQKVEVTGREYNMHEPKVFIGYPDNDLNVCGDVASSPELALDSFNQKYKEVTATGLNGLLSMFYVSSVEPVDSHPQLIYGISVACGGEDRENTERGTSETKWAPVGRSHFQ